MPGDSSCCKEAQLYRGPYRERDVLHRMMNSHTGHSGDFPALSLGLWPEDAPSGNITKMPCRILASQASVLRAGRQKGPVGEPTSAAGLSAAATFAGPGSLRALERAGVCLTHCFLRRSHLRVSRVSHGLQGRHRPVRTRLRTFHTSPGCCTGCIWLWPWRRLDKPAGPPSSAVLRSSPSQQMSSREY